MKKIITKLKKRLPSQAFKKVYTGNIFERFIGLDILLKNCKNMKVLDFGSAEGLIAYEFSRSGVDLIHGFEIDKMRVKFSKRLFQEVPIESNFVSCNLAIDSKTFQNQHKNILLEKYDIVLYLGVYHHLLYQTDIENVHDMLKYLLKSCNTFFAVRTNRINEFEDIILKEGFETHYEAPIQKDVGLLKIYKRIN